MASPRNSRPIYWLAALALGIALVLGIRHGATWSRLTVSATLLAAFGLLGCYPTAAGRPRWATGLTAALMALALGVLILRLSGQLA
jgi:uncharacterized membrane-anchored protein YhcB (DUF1043 family)